MAKKKPVPKRRKIKLVRNHGKNRHRDLKPILYLLRISAESFTPEKPNLSENEKELEDLQYSTEFISFAGSITSSLRKLDERIALLDEHHTNIELLIGAATGLSRNKDSMRLGVPA